MDRPTDCEVGDHACNSEHEWKTLAAAVLHANSNIQDFHPYSSVENFTHDYINGKPGGAIDQLNSLPITTTQILRVLKSLPQNANIKDAWKNYTTGHADAVTDNNLIALTDLWRVCVELRNSTFAAMPLGDTATLIRAELKEDIAQANATYKGYIDLWKQHGLRDKPFLYLPEVERFFQAIGRMDPETGQISGDVPPQLSDAVSASNRAR